MPEAIVASDLLLLGKFELFRPLFDILLDPNKFLDTTNFKYISWKVWTNRRVASPTNRSVVGD